MKTIDFEIGILGAGPAVLLIELVESAHLKSNRDELYRLVREDDTYHEADFIDAVRRLRQSLEHPLPN